MKKNSKNYLFKFNNLSGLMGKKRNYKIIGEFQMDGEQAEKINKMIEVADKEIEESRVYFRFGKKQTTRCC